MVLFFAPKYVRASLNNSTLSVTTNSVVVYGMHIFVAAGGAVLIIQDGDGTELYRINGASGDCFSFRVPTLYSNGFQVVESASKSVSVAIFLWSRWCIMGEVATDIKEVTLNSATAVEIIASTDTVIVLGIIVSADGTTDPAILELQDSDGNTLLDFGIGATERANKFQEPFLVTNGLQASVTLGTNNWRVVVFHGGAGS